MRTIAEIVTRGKDGGGGVGSRVGRAQVVSRIRRTRQERIRYVRILYTYIRASQYSNLSPLSLSIVKDRK